MDASIFIAGVAVLIALGSLWVSVLSLRVARRGVAIEDQREADRNAQKLEAKLSCRVEKKEPNKYQLCIRNNGDARAVIDDLTIDDGPYLDHPLVPKGLSGFPAVLNPGKESCIPIAPHTQSKQTFRLKVLFSDQTNEKKSFTDELSWIGS